MNLVSILFYLCLSSALWINAGLGPVYFISVQAYLTTTDVKLQPDQDEHRHPSL